MLQLGGVWETQERLYSHHLSPWFPVVGTRWPVLQHWRWLIPSQETKLDKLEQWTRIRRAPLHRLRTMFYCRCQGLPRAFDSCDSIAQMFGVEALISCVDSLARAGDPCFESLGRIQGAVAPSAKPCAFLSLSLPLSCPFPSNLQCSSKEYLIYVSDISSQTYLNITWMFLNVRDIVYCIFFSIL